MVKELWNCFREGSPKHFNVSGHCNCTYGKNYWIGKQSFPSFTTVGKRKKSLSKFLMCFHCSEGFFQFYVFLLGGAQRFDLCWFLWRLLQSPSSLLHCLSCPFGSFCLALQIYLFHPPLTYLLIFITVGEGRMRLKPSCIFKKRYKICSTNGSPMY